MRFRRLQRCNLRIVERNLLSDAVNRHFLYVGGRKAVCFFKPLLCKNHIRVRFGINGPRRRQIGLSL